MNKFMRAALKEAYKGISLGHGGPFGCVIVKEGKIIARGHNKVVKNNDPTAHGEVVALRQAGKKLKTFDLSGCELYTTGEPCPMCLGSILWANISKVYYGCDINDAEMIGFRDKVFYAMKEKKRSEKLSQIDHEACYKLFKDYQNIHNKTAY